MHRPAVFHIPAKSDRQALQRTLFIRKRHKVGERLRRVQMPAVARVDNGAFGIKRRGKRRAFHRIAHHDQVRVAADNANGVFQALPLCNRRIGRVVKADNLATETQHSSLEGHLRTCRRLVKQRRHDLTMAGVCKYRGVIADHTRQTDDLRQILFSHICKVDQIACLHIRHSHDVGFPRCVSAAFHAASALAFHFIVTRFRKKSKP